MTDEEKRRAARALIELRQFWGPPKLPANTPGELGELLARYFERMRGVMADLYVEHFSDQQVQAQLDFYGSETGKAILEKESEITAHFQDRVRELSRELNDEASRHSGALTSWRPFGPQ